MLRQYREKNVQVAKRYVFWLASYRDMCGIAQQQSAGTS